MVIMAVKKYRYVLGTLVFSLVLLMIIVGLFSIDNSTNKMIVEYIQNFGWQVEPTPAEITHLTLPKEFDAVYETYNAVQLGAGFDLEPFRGKKVTRYTYKILNHKESPSSQVMAGVFVYENSIIAGDISSADMSGFMHAINETSNILGQ